MGCGGRRLSPERPRTRHGKFSFTSSTFKQLHGVRHEHEGVASEPGGMQVLQAVVSPQNSPQDHRWESSGEAPLLPTFLHLTVFSTLQ